MSCPQVLRIPRSDEDEGSFVLAHVQPSSSRKARPLDVKIVATEGSAPYVVTLKHISIQALKSPGSPCSNEEWEQILESLFLGQVTTDIHLTAAVRSGLEITVRKKVQRITQRLGVINLQEDESEAVELLDWCGLALESANDARAELASARAKAEELEQAVSDLGKQLYELVQAKTDHEAAIFGKFRLLLNEKKAKIREQHEIIKSHGLDSSPIAAQSRPDGEEDQVKAEESDDRGTTSMARTSRRPAASRKPKRKALAAELSSSSDAGFDVMDVDQAKQVENDNDGNSSDDQKHTSDENGDATASEPDESSPAAKGQPQPQPRINAKDAGKAKLPAQGTAVANDIAAANTAGASQTSAGKPLTTRARKPPPPKAGTASEDGSETESDDEL